MTVRGFRTERVPDDAMGMCPHSRERVLHIKVRNHPHKERRMNPPEKGRDSGCFRFHTGFHAFIFTYRNKQVAIIP